MKKSRFVFCTLLCCCVMVSAASLPFQVEPKIPRKIEIGQTPSLKMAEMGKVLFEIVVPQTASPTAKFAGQELAEQLGKAFNTKLSVRSTASGTAPAIVVGDTALAAKLGIDLAKLDRDGFVIRTSGNQVLIIGRDDPKLAPRRATVMPGISETGQIPAQRDVEPGTGSRKKVY